MSGDQQRHTKSEGLKYVLRRRGRNRKTGANTGEKVYGWAEYSQVNFTPSGDHSRISSIFGVLATFGALLIVPTIFVLAASAGEDGLLPFLRVLFETCLALLLLAAFCLPLIIPTALIIWIYVRLDGNGKKDRAHLNAAVDKLLSKQAEPQDDGANRAR